MLHLPTFLTRPTRSESNRGLVKEQPMFHFAYRPSKCHFFYETLIIPLESDSGSEVPLKLGPPVFVPMDRELEASPSSVRVQQQFFETRVVQYAEAYPLREK